MVTNPIIVAIDTIERGAALELAQSVAADVGAFKIGLGLLHGPGSGLIRELTELGRPVFADAKLHDIPSQVERAATALGEAGARWVTVHGSGGIEMMEAAVRGLARGSQDDAGVLAVSILTSLDAPALRHVGIDGRPPDLVAAMARAAATAGAEGLVCSPHEIAIARSVSSQLAVVTPGIRPAGSADGDQRRVATPQEALQAGASWLVIGRPITASEDPARAARTILASLDPAPAE